jgi:hypothetical protein
MVYVASMTLQVRRPNRSAFAASLPLCPTPLLRNAVLRSAFGVSKDTRSVRGQSRRCILAAAGHDTQPGGRFVHLFFGSLYASDGDTLAISTLLGLIYFVYLSVAWRYEQSASVSVYWLAAAGNSVHQWQSLGGTAVACEVDGRGDVAEQSAASCW